MTVSDASHKAGSIVAVILGAYEWPRFPSVEACQVIRRSAVEFKRYLRDLRGLALLDENIKDLFNDSRSPNDILEEIKLFLASRPAATDLLMYYVGHGATVSSANDFRLLVRYSDLSTPDATTLAVVHLGEALREKARRMRWHFIIDACYAAKAVHLLQGIKGVSVLCAANQITEAKAPQGAQLTMFTDPLLYALRTGDRQSRDARLTMRDINRLAVAYATSTWGEQAVRSEVHSPSQADGDIADVPFFPNPAVAPFATEVSEPDKEFLHGSRTVQICISQVFRVADLHIFPESVRVRKFLNVITDKNKLRRALNRHTSFRLGTLGSIKPVAAISERFDGFWKLSVPDLRRPGTPPLWFLPFELSLTSQLAALRSEPSSVLGEILSQSEEFVDNTQLSGRLRIYPPGVGIVRLAITLTFRGSIHVASVARIAKDIEQLLLVDPNGLGQPCEDVVLGIIDQVAEALFAGRRLGYEERRWRPPETMYILHDDCGFRPEENIESLARIMCLAPRNQQATDELQALLRGCLSSSHWTKERVLAAAGQGTSLLFLETSERPAKEQKRKQLRHWLEETAEVVSAAAYSEKAFLEELERICDLRALDDTWLPDSSTNFAFLSSVLRTMKTVFQATALMKLQLERRGAGILMTFANEIWASSASASSHAVSKDLHYVKQWLKKVRAVHGEGGVAELEGCISEILAMPRPFRSDRKGRQVAKTGANSTA